MTATPRILVAEDEPLLATHLLKLLQQAWPAALLLPVAPHGHAALEQALSDLPEVLFLDIQMPGLTGLALIEPLLDGWPETRPLPLIVYVTAYDQYAVSAFERAAVDYLLKPITLERLQQTVGRLQSQLGLQEQARQQTPEDASTSSLMQLSMAQIQQWQQIWQPASSNGQPLLRYISASVGKQTRLIPIEEVLYFEAADKYVRVVTQQDETLIRTPLKDLLPQLDATQFWQIHRAIVVQAAAISHVQRDENGKLTLSLKQRPERLPVSRLYTERFKSM
ncbi:LytR/AlgR family response regulator transcription factor [Parvibium lacunae]|uniref:DNA-binding response regulator n=1 Tax=Parvibium lacunae TaxID=1888893 RepID=A0A368L1T8_9BURK|nr:LytTR family DNA-binding domain-containing protein [Parvibium lacunae]RCS57519.1 DNA-binding response regulator [Parvibium lacunae]